MLSLAQAVAEVDTIEYFSGIYPIDDHQVLVDQQEMNQLSRDSFMRKLHLSNKNCYLPDEYCLQRFYF